MIINIDTRKGEVHMKRTRIIFDRNDKSLEPHNKIVQIICKKNWAGTVIDRAVNENYICTLVEMVMNDVIKIDEYEYRRDGLIIDNESAERIKSRLGKRDDHPVLNDIGALFGIEQLERTTHFRNTAYIPALKALLCAGGVKPGRVSQMLLLDGCEKIILFPYYLADNKTAYYELMLGIGKDEFVDYMNNINGRR
jgi:hypothetical protein